MNLAEIITGQPDVEWMEDGRCRYTYPDAFHPEKGEGSGEAKRVCAGCPVKRACLEWALRHDERHGIWGGLSSRERRRLQRFASLPSGIPAEPLNEDTTDGASSLASAW